jgi:hypothetical protein
MSLLSATPQSKSGDLSQRFPAQLTNTPLLSRQWLVDSLLALLLGIVLSHPPTDHAHANIHYLADGRDVKALFCNHEGAP